MYLLFLQSCVHAHKASRYVASRCADLVDMWFWIGSKKFRDTQILRRFWTDFFNNNQISWALLYLIFANLDRLLEFYPMNDVRFMQFFHSQLMDNWGFSASAGTYSVLWRYHSSIKVMCLLKSFQYSRCQFLIQILPSSLLWSSLFIVIEILLWVEKFSTVAKVGNDFWPSWLYFSTMQRCSEYKPWHSSEQVEH